MSTNGDAEAVSHVDFIPRKLSDGERQHAWKAANFEVAVANQPHPLVLWILGPSAVGKSTTTLLAAPRFGIPLLMGGQAGSDRRTALDAVIIDGEFIRDVHAGYQKWIQTPEWKSAYPALKSTFNKEKDRLFAAAASEKKHMVIPQTLLNIEKCLTEVQELYAQGYTNHVLAVIAPWEECQRRGKARETMDGKRYEAREYHRSICAIPPMLAKCDGRFQVVQAVACNDAKTMTLQVLFEGDCGDGGVQMTPEQLLEAIGEPVENCSQRVPPVASWSLERTRHPSLVATALEPEERRRAWESANFYGASSKRERPSVLWILGPPCVGKSCLLRQLWLSDLEDVRGEDFGIARSEGDRPSMDSVIVDGGFIWRVYGVYLRTRGSPEHQMAKLALKSIVRKEKDRLWSEAASERKNIIMVRRVTDINKGLTEIEELMWQGYTNHVLAVVAPMHDCALRAAQAGMACEKEDYDKSLVAILRMIAACNGCYKVVQALHQEQAACAVDSGDDGEANKPSLQHRLIADGRGVRTKETPATSMAFDPFHGVKGLIETAVGQAIPEL